jgi:glycine/D-amino acid oxidase-like deaminating enzyme
LRRAPKEVKARFNPDLVEDVFLVQEYAFDAQKLKTVMSGALAGAGVDVMLNLTVKRIEAGGRGLEIETTGVNGSGKFEAGYVFNCTYARINTIMQASELPQVPLKHELTEMALVEMPKGLRHTGFTVMDGPFFSIMPFPARGVHSFSHVRYTPHHYWQDRSGQACMDPYRYLNSVRPDSHYVYMLKDAERYLPSLKDCRYLESLWEVKTVLPQCEVDDSRPILFRRSEKSPRLITVMGGKIDNIYDIREKLEVLVASGWGEQ